MNNKQKTLMIMLAITALILNACGQTATTIPQGLAVQSPPAPAQPSRTISMPEAAVFTLPGGIYDAGTPVLQELYVAPDGDDSRSGAAPEKALRTLTEAWNRLPGNTTGTGYRINLLPGTYPCGDDESNNCLNQFTDRTGTFEQPIVISALNGPGTVFLRGGLDLAHVTYLYLIDLNLVGGGDLPTNISGNNLLHLYDGQHVLFRRLVLDGPNCTQDNCTNLQEVLKVNQAQYLYVENSDIGGAWHTSVDFFAVQYGHFLNNDLHTAGQWCMYIKGGSAHLAISGNRFHDCQLGFQAGQAANFAMMVPPWLQYEAYGVRFTNNLLYNIPGVGMSVAGGYNILLAYNTFYRVGFSQETGYPLLSLVRGERNCTPTDELPDPAPVCQANANAGGWGPTFDTSSFNPDDLAVIPNRHVYVLNNLFYNPQPAQTAYAHFFIQGPFTPPAGIANLPAPVRADDDLVIAGNLIWNGPPGYSLGVEEQPSGCYPENPTCNFNQLTGNNTINALEPQLVNPQALDFRPVAGGNVFTLPTYPIPAFSWKDAPGLLPVPAASPDDQMPADILGQPRQFNSPPGAYGEAKSK